MPSIVSRPLMERYLGRKLEKTEFVHHINGDKRDNRLENLQVVSPSQHRRLHHTGGRKLGIAKGMESITLEISNLLSFTAAAKLLGVSRPTIYNLIVRHKLHPLNIGPNRYLLREEVERLKNEQALT